MKLKFFYFKFLYNYQYILNPIYLFYAIPILVLIKIISPVIIIRFNYIISDRIGHLVEDYLLYVLLKNNKYKIKNKFYFDIFFLKKKKICNYYFLNYLKKNLNVYPHFLIIPIWNILNKLSKLTNIFDSHFGYKKNSKKDGYQFYNPNKESIMKLSPIEIQKGELFLKSIGVKNSDKFVCLNIHDNFYLEKEFPNNNWDHHKVRISNINNYTDSIKFLNKKRIFVLRMGRYTKNKLDINSNLFYDYSSSNQRSDFLDFFLISRCYFYFSNNTGLDNVALLFNKPMLKSSHSFIHLDVENDKNILFFHYHYDKKNKKFLNYKQIMQLRSNKYKNYKSKFFDEHNIELIENDSKEIKSYVEEMLLSMENKLNIDTHEKKLSNEFWQNYKEFNLNMGISYYLNNPIKANICSKYLLNQFEKSKKK